MAQSGSQIKGDPLDTPQISRSGRVLKKSAKVKEMEDFDINELDGTGKPRKRSRTSDEFDELDDKRVAPIKIPKLSIGTPAASPAVQKRPPPQMIQKMVKPKQYFHDASKDSDSSSASSETSSSSPSSSEDSDSEPGMQQQHHQQPQRFIPQQIESKVVVEPPYRQFESPASFVDHTPSLHQDSSDEDESDTGLVIAEERSSARGRKPTPARRTTPAKKRPPQRPPKKEKPASDKPPKPLTAYMLWCLENRKKVIASSTHLGMGNVSKKLGEAWQALPDKEKLAWRRKARKLALKNATSMISTGPAPRGRTISAAQPTLPDDEGSVTLGTASIDSAAYLKLLGDSLSVIGQRLTEHEGQLAVSGIFSVLLDTVLCVVGPLLCLTSESLTAASIPTEVHKRTLDSIAYFMPGL